MKTLTVALPGREYDILIGRGLLTQAGERCRAVMPKAAKLAVVSDSNVAPLYGQVVLDSLTGAGFEPRLFTVPAGEHSKNASQLSQLWEGAADQVDIDAMNETAAAFIRTSDALMETDYYGTDS